MSDYKEQANLLREHADLIETSIELYGPSATRLLVYDLRNAAAAIEELQDKVFELEEELNDAEIAADDNGRQVEELQAEIERLKDSNEELRERQAYIDHYGTEWLTSAKDVPNYAYEHGYADGMAEVKAQLSKQGKWVRVEDGESYHYECSECGERPLYSRYGDVVLSGVCPLCGAKMMEVQE